MIKMEKKTMVWILIGVLFLVALFLTFKVSTLSATGGAIAGTGKIDTTGWTENEIMNYEMHGTLPARVGSSASTGSSGGMVGGC